MRLSTIITIFVAIVLGGVAAFLAKVWLESQAQEPRIVQVSGKVKTSTVVVASRPLRFGVALTKELLVEVEWPLGAIPEGSFAKMAGLLKGEKRTVLSSIEKNEPVLKWKISGPGQRASLSALIGDNGMKAVTIRVDEVKGVAGFVLPGDRVDIFLTRSEATGEGNSQQFTDLLLQNVKVLAVGQIADDRTEKPTLVKAVTVEVSPINAQKLILAKSAGRLSLALRRAGESGRTKSRRITLGDLGTSSVGSPPPEKQEDIEVIEEPDLNALIGVIRRTKRPAEYSVPKR